jgi:hypothetical protein
MPKAATAHETASTMNRLTEKARGNINFAFLLDIAWSQTC